MSVIVRKRAADLTGEDLVLMYRLFCRAYRTLALDGIERDLRERGIATLEREEYIKCLDRRRGKIGEFYLQNNRSSVSAWGKTSDAEQQRQRWRYVQLMSQHFPIETYARPPGRRCGQNLELPFE